MVLAEDILERWCHRMLKKTRSRYFVCVLSRESSCCLDSRDCRTEKRRRDLEAKAAVVFATLPCEGNGCTAQPTV